MDQPAGDQVERARPSPAREDGTPDDLIAGTGRFAQLHAAWRDSLV